MLHIRAQKLLMSPKATEGIFLSSIWNISLVAHMHSLFENKKVFA